MLIEGFLAALLCAQAPPADPAEALLKRMTLEEKVALVHGGSEFDTAALPRLGLRAYEMVDASHGVHRRDNGPATCFPTGIAQGAAWDPELERRLGEALGQETKAVDSAFLLGPAINMVRTPLGGRTFEYTSEDPWLSGRLAVAWIRGVQAQGVLACVKHFAANSVELNRFKDDSKVDERTLRELYLPAFEAAVKEGGAASVMSAYNLLNGRHCTENAWLNETVLRKEWGFKGILMSDWGAVNSTVPAALGGTDLEMPGDPENCFGAPLLAAVRKGEVPVAAIDAKVRRILSTLLPIQAPTEAQKARINTPEHQRLALEAARASMVLLKNEGGLLPLDLAALKKIAVIGPMATVRCAGGGGSSSVFAAYERTPLEGLRARVGAAAKVTFHRGVPLPRQLPVDAAEVDQAAQAAREADVAIVLVGTGHQYDSEGYDKPDLRLPGGQDRLVAAVAAANPRTVVVLVAGSAVEMPWLGQARAVLDAWYPGMEGGTALAELLFGDVTPSGKLPITFPRSLKDVPSHAAGDYPAKDHVLPFSEGLFMGYRHCDAHGVEPLFPFGFGLSYTTFAYQGLKLSAEGDRVLASFQLTNTGARAGAETAQLYVAPRHPSVPRPAQELKGFQKVRLARGESRTVTLELDRRAFAHWDLASGAWVVDPGAYEIRIGASSRDVRLRADVER